MKKVNIVIGRFQPFTEGHYLCIQTAKKISGLNTVICMIDTAESKADKRHPFPTNMILKVYDGLFSNDSLIEDVVTVKSANIVLIGEELRKRGYEIGSWSCGTDRYADYSRMAERYHDKAGLSDDFRCIEIPRTDEDVSATKARNCLLSDDFRGFIDLMPKSMMFDENDYELMRSQINKVYKVDEMFRRVVKLERFFRFSI